MKTQPPMESSHPSLLIRMSCGSGKWTVTMCGVSAVRSLCVLEAGAPTMKCGACPDVHEGVHWRCGSTPRCPFLLLLSALTQPETCLHGVEGEGSSPGNPRRTWPYGNVTWVPECPSWENSGCVCGMGQCVAPGTPVAQAVSHTWVPVLTCCAWSCFPLCSRLCSSCSASRALSSSASPRLACSSSRSWSRLSSCCSRVLCLACRDCGGGGEPVWGCGTHSPQP